MYEYSYIINIYLSLQEEKDTQKIETKAIENEADLGLLIKNFGVESVCKTMRVTKGTSIPQN